MTVLIVVESLFINSMVTVVRTDAAPGVLPPEVDLLLVGAPTHAFSLLTPKSRAQDASAGAPPARRVGVREWVGQLTPRPNLRVVTFDTSVRLLFSPGSAAKVARRLLRRRGFTAAERGPSCYVTGTAGPPAEGEQQRASGWAAQPEAGRLLEAGARRLDPTGGLISP